MHTLANIQRVAPSVEYQNECALEARDNAFLAIEDRKAEIERSVTRADLFEEIAETWTGYEDAVFMKALARGDRMGDLAMRALVDLAKERIVRRRLAGEA